jgi:hypothetical protein
MHPMVFVDIGCVCDHFKHFLNSVLTQAQVFDKF